MTENGVYTKCEPDGEKIFVFGYRMKSFDFKRQYFQLMIVWDNFDLANDLFAIDIFFN